MSLDWLINVIHKTFIALNVIIVYSVLAAKSDEKIVGSIRIHKALQNKYIYFLSQIKIIIYAIGVACLPADFCFIKLVQVRLHYLITKKWFKLSFLLLKKCP